MTDSAGRSPYVGNRPFKGQDSDVFFGRKTEIAEVASLWRRHQLTLLFGSSGARLTSLVRAGVIPQVVAPFVEVLPVGRVSDGSPFPVAALGDHNPHSLSLLSAWSPSESKTRLADLTLTGFLRKRWQYTRPTDAYGRLPAVLSAIDQAEELVTGQVSGGEFCDAFIAELAEALREIPELHVLCCVRRDYRGELAARLTAGGCAPETQFELHPLSPVAAVKAVREPAAASGRHFATGVAEKIVADLSGGDFDGPQVAPALLQPVCARLWRAVPEHVRVITELDLRECGGVGQLLADHCDQVVATVASDHDLLTGELWSWIQEWFLTGRGKRALVEEGIVETRGMPNAVVRALRDRHMISAEKQAGSRWYALQHDCLVTPVTLAQERLRGLAEMHPVRERPAEYLDAAEAAMAAGEPSLARRHAAQALRASSGQNLRLAAATESLLGNAAYSLGDMATAEQHYRTASALYETLRDTPMVAHMLAAIGRTLLNRGRYRDAVGCLYGAVARLPSDPAVQTELGRAVNLIELVG